LFKLDAFHHENSFLLHNYVMTFLTFSLWNSKKGGKKICLCHKGDFLQHLDCSSPDCIKKAYVKEEEEELYFKVYSEKFYFLFLYHQDFR